jgi:DNA topoisomerase-1
VQSEQLKDMENDAQKLYQLIWRQFVACQMMPAQYDSTTLTVEAADFKLKAKGRTLRFDGWTRVMAALRKGDEDRVLPDVAVGSELSLQQLVPSQHFTKPPARFSEASLVRELEKRGIGRPSTYASIISTIQDRGYVKVESRRFYAEKMGEIVTDRLEESFRDLMNYDFTAHMEDNLDKVAKNEAQWKAVLDQFFAEFSDHCGSSAPGSEASASRNNRISATRMLVSCRQVFRPKASIRPTPPCRGGSADGSARSRSSPSSGAAVIRLVSLTVTAPSRFRRTCPAARR